MDNIERLQLQKEENLEQYNFFIEQLVHFQKVGMDQEVKTLLGILKEIQSRILNIDIAIAIQKDLQNNQEVQNEIRK